MIDDVVGLYQRFPYPSRAADAEPIFDLANGLAFGLHDEELAGWQVADIGCGTGHRLVALAQRYPRARFVGVEPAESALRFARRLVDRHQVRNVELLHGSVPDVELPGPCDLIVCSGVIHHLSDPDAGLGWLGRQLRPDGLVFLWLYNAVGEHDRMLDRELVRLLADGPADLAVVRELGLSLSPTRYGATAGSSRELTDDAADTLDAAAFLNPVVTPFRFADTRWALASLGLEWISGLGVNFNGGSKLLDLSGVEESGPWYVSGESEFADVRVRRRVRRLPNHEKAAAIELRLRPTGFSVLAGTRTGLDRCLPRVRGNVLFSQVPG